MKSFNLWRILACLLLAAPAYTQPTLDYPALSDSIQNILDSTSAPGAQVAIFTSDSILFLGNFGWADKEAEIPVDDETFFRIGSVTKTFVATAALQLVESGQLRLEDEIKQLVPDVFVKNKFEDSPITIEHLLEHTSGFDDLHLKEYAAPAEGWSLEKGVNFHPHNRTARWEPGTHMSYCNSGPPLVAYAIEKITQRDFEDLVKERIFDPLGMTYSSFIRTPEVDSRISKGYGADGNEEMPYWHISQRPAGSINSNVTEMASFVQMLMKNGSVDSVQILSPASIGRMEQSQTTLSGKAGYHEGYGLHNYTTNYKGMIWHGHDGGMMGFLAKANYNREMDLGFVTLVNATNGAIGQINGQIYEFIYQSNDNVNRPPEVELDPESEKRILGYYKSATSRNEMARMPDFIATIYRVGKDDEGYFVRHQLGDSKERAYAIAQDALILEGDNGYVTPMVFTDYQGKVYAQQVNRMNNLVKAGFFRSFTPLALAGLTALFGGILVLIGIIWIPLRAFGVFRKGRWSLRYLPILVAAGIAGFLIFFNRASQGNMLEKMGNLGTDSGGIFISSLLIGIGMLFFCWSRIRTRADEEASWFRVVTGITGILFIIAFVYLLTAGMIGFRTWAY